MSGGSAKAAGPATIAAVPDEDVRLGLLADFIGFHLRLSQEASYQSFARRFATRGGGALALKPGHFTLLSLIGDNPGITQTALSRAGGRDKSSLTPVLDMLVRAGFIRRQRIRNDRRSYALSLTADGEALRNELTAHAVAHDAELDRIVGAEHKAELIRLLRRIKMALG